MRRIFHQTLFKKTPSFFAIPSSHYSAAVVSTDYTNENIARRTKFETIGHQGQGNSYSRFDNSHIGNYNIAMKKKITADEQRLSKHDPAFKFFLSEKEIAENFLQEHLPSKIALKMDSRTLQIVKDTFVDKKLSQYYSDILYEIKFQGKHIFIDLLFDHKSTEDRFMGFQFLKYKVRIWEYYFKQHKNTRYLPVIIGIRNFIILERIFSYD